MGKFHSELTRKYLLNSQSRGSLEEVTEIDAEEEFAAQEQPLQDDEPWLAGDIPGGGSSEGQELTQNYFRQYYD
ncbi:hypothetical protein QNH46_04690 [Paenibacillus woosongensis]|uniref:Uncharacterized protein n=1 Tax=Paenibacillus woosongensis TaxID=307580 RepID=A0AA95I5S8_9BACL|nr:hypothetical protein [Paenibacillus woosongensis]WHX49971.1 hypothetical protein QNH46_04690 [Paenibacillus woosongensis]GIP60566.1 hypothetical protein J15TS10_43800 [Paenibacillus woosongensis]